MGCDVTPSPGSPEAAEAAAASAHPTSAAAINRGVFRGGIWNVGGQVSLIVGALVATPFVIRLLGVRAYGLLALLGLVIGYGAFVDLGMGAASTKFAADAFGRRDTEAEVVVVWSAALITLVPSLITATLLAVMSRSLSEQFLRLRGTLAQEAAIAIRITCAGFVLKALCGVFNTSLVVRMRWALNTLIMNGTMVAATLLVPFVLWMGGGVAAAISIEVAGVGIALVANLFATRSLVPSLWPPRVSVRLLRRLTAFGAGMTVTGLATLLLVEIDRFVLARMVSVSAVGYYTVAATVASLLNIIPFAIGGPLLPGFAVLLSSSQDREAAELYARALRVIVVLTLPLVLALVAVARMFLAIWAGPSFVHHSSNPLFFLVIAVAFNAVAAVPYNAISASGHPELLARRNLAQILPYAGAIIVAVHFWGPTGAAATAAIRSLVALVLYLRAARNLVPPSARVLHRHWASYLGLVIWTAGPALVIALSNPPLVVLVPLTSVALLISARTAWRGLEPAERTFLSDQLVAFRRQRVIAAGPG